MAITVDARLYGELATIARNGKQSVPQTVRMLVEEALSRRRLACSSREDTPRSDILVTVRANNAFDWLAGEPDIYDDTFGEPVRRVLPIE